MFLRNSVEYTQDTMEEALRRVKLMQADLGGTEILAPLRNIYSAASTPGRPLQVSIGAERTEGGARLHSVQEPVALSLLVGLLTCGMLAEVSVV